MVYNKYIKFLGGFYMITRTIDIAKGVRANYIHTDKFKTNYVSFNFITQADKERSYLNAMIPVILMRGCKKYLL